MGKKVDILSMPVNKALFSMSTPVSLGMLSTFLIQVVDTYFVGKLGSKELAALGFSSAGFFLVVGLFFGLSVGVSALIGKALGEKKDNKVKSLVLISLILTIVFSLLVNAIGYFTIKPFFSMLGASPQVLPLISEYMEIIYIGLPFLIIALIGNAAVRTSGSIRAPEISMAVGGLINLIFDYLLIFGIGPFPKLGIKGAAVASVISFVFVFIISFVLLNKNKLLSFHPIKKFKNGIKSILSLSLPAVLTQILVPVTFIVITFIISKFGDNAVAALGIASRVESLVLVGIFGVSVAITPFVAQNFGAKKYKRIDQAIIFAGKYSVYTGILLFLILVIFAGPIASFFTDDPGVINIVKFYFYIIAFSYIFYGLIVVTTSIFNAVHLPKKALNLLFVKSFVFTIPLILIGFLFGIKGVFIGLSVANILGGIYAGKLIHECLEAVGSSISERKPIDDYKNDIRNFFRKK